MEREKEEYVYLHKWLWPHEEACGILKRGNGTEDVDRASRKEKEAKHPTTEGMWKGLVKVPIVFKHYSQIQSPISCLLSAVFRICTALVWSLEPINISVLYYLCLTNVYNVFSS